MQRLRRNVFDGPVVRCAESQNAAQRRPFDMARSPHLKPGELAPTAGAYSEHNVFGSPTGRKLDIIEGEPMPRAPVGFTWLATEAPALKRPSR